LSKQMQTKMESRGITFCNESGARYMATASAYTKLQSDKMQLVQHLQAML